MKKAKKVSDDNPNRDLLNHKGKENKSKVKVKSIQLENLHSNVIEESMKVKKNTAPINKKREITQKDIQENNQKYQDVKDFVNDNKIMENIAKANIKKPIDQSHSVAASAHLKKIEKSKSINKASNDSKIDGNNYKDVKSFHENLLENFVENSKKGKFKLKIEGNTSNTSISSNNAKEKPRIASLKSKVADLLDKK